MSRFTALVAFLVFASSALSADEFQGAEAVLKRIAQALKEPGKAGHEANPLVEILKGFDALKNQPEALKPADAAAKWLDLFDRFLALSPEVLNDPRNYPHQFRQMTDVAPYVEALPPTAAWDAIATSLEARVGRNPSVRNATFGVFAAILRGDAKQRQQALEVLRSANARARPAGVQEEMMERPLDGLLEALAKADGDKEAQVALFEESLRNRETNPDSSRLDRGSFSIPDLAKLASPEKAQSLLVRALALGQELTIEGAKTQRLAAELALKNIGLLKKAQWSLVTELGDVPLYEAMKQRFPAKSREDANSRDSADKVYLVALIAGNRTREAVAFLKTLRATLRDDGSPFGTDFAFANLTRKGFDKQLNSFLRESLAGDPALPFWQSYIETSARIGEADQALTFLREIATKPGLKPAARLATDEWYARALLAADHVDEAIPVLREMIKAGSAAAVGNAEAAQEEGKKEGGVPGDEVPGEPNPRSRFNAQDQSQTQIEHCLRLAEIGALTGRAELVNEAIADARAALKSEPGRALDFGRVGRVAGFLLAHGRLTEAETIVADQLVTARDPANSSRYLLEMLALIYDRADRFDDVMRLLDGARQWGMSDVSAFAGNENFGSPLLIVAARALLKTGKSEEGRKALDRLIETKPGYDPAYALLLELHDPNVEAYLDFLMKRDRFEERPLIWKAKLQLDSGRIDEAEKTVRAAIAIDPSDGEEGKGDRMRAYAVLADVLEKKGGADQAKIYRGAVEAIRLSEDADDWWEAGLLTASVKMYEKALGHFADAYCIQSRLALRYSELGDFGKAAQHYERAFELMPESFGRVESHCFGCEGAFRGDRAQGIAERVFTRLAEKMPGKPQVFYLLGYLRQEQGDSAAAAAQFMHAATLDPDYLNAWLHLLEVGEDGSDEVKAAMLALLRLDPGQRHHQGDFRMIGNPRALWDAILAAEANRPRPSRGAIYPLAASKLIVENRVKAARESGDPYAESRNPELQDGGRQNELGPRAQFAQQSVFMSLVQFLMRDGVF